MLGGSSAFNAVVDVSVIVPACFENPLRDAALEFLGDVLALKRKAALPTSAFLGAYHIATRYLRAPRVAVKKILAKLLETRSPAFYQDISIDLVLDALDYAAGYRVESWDGYVIAVAVRLGASVVYSLDKELSRARVVEVVSPFPEEEVAKYHEYLRSLLERREER